MNINSISTYYKGRNKRIFEISSVGKSMGTQFSHFMSVGKLI
jgi:hypothetical protein